MTRQETVLQYTKMILLAIIMVIALGRSTQVVHGQGFAGSGYGYTYIHTATSTQVSTIGQILHTITINGGTGGTVTLYDNSSCATTPIGVIASTTAPVTLVYDLQLKTGLCITTAAATDLTVTTR